MSCGHWIALWSTPPFNRLCVFRFHNCRFIKILNRSKSSYEEKSQRQLSIPFWLEPSSGKYGLSLFRENTEWLGGPSKVRKLLADHLQMSCENIPDSTYLFFQVDNKWGSPAQKRSWVFWYNFHIHPDFFKSCFWMFNAQKMNGVPQQWSYWHYWRLSDFKCRTISSGMSSWMNEVPFHISTAIFRYGLIYIIIITSNCVPILTHIYIYWQWRYGVSMAWSRLFINALIESTENV